MLYWLFKYLSANFDFPGLRLMDYVSFRAGISLAVALLIALVVSASFTGCSACRLEKWCANWVWKDR